LSNLGEIVENFVLYAISKVSVIFVRTDVLEWKNGDALLVRNRFG